jgi:hypothetical protein
MATETAFDRGGFELPDQLSFLFPLFSLLNKDNLPSPPNLDDYGIGKEKVRGFFNLKRALGRAGIQRQGAQATRTAVGSLPSSLKQSTIPASIASGIQTKVGGQLGQFEADVMGEEINTYSKLYDQALKKYGLELEAAQADRSREDQMFDVLSLLPLFI